ncbi:hypothetical protein COOONC_21996 [Cooperia oncophora]
MQSFALLIVIFVCSWCTAGVTTVLGIKYLPKGPSLIFQTYTVVIVLPSYCQCYFVSYIRSPRHRSAYQKQLRTLFPCLFNPEREDPTYTSTVSAKNSTR